MCLEWLREAHHNVWRKSTYDFISLSLYIYIYIYICVYISLYIYIYIHRDREREREREYMYWECLFVGKPWLELLAKQRRLLLLLRHWNIFRGACVLFLKEKVIVYFISAIGRTFSEKKHMNQGVLVRGGHKTPITGIREKASKQSKATENPKH